MPLCGLVGAAPTRVGRVVHTLVYHTLAYYTLVYHTLVYYTRV